MFKCFYCERPITKVKKGACNNCYKKYIWKGKKIICRRCRRELYHHAKGYCGGCYNFLFHLEKNKSENIKKWYNLDYESYLKITKECIICGFDKAVELHHIDRNHSNNSKENLVGICPNHHKMIHMYKYRKQICKILEEKCYRNLFNKQNI